MKSRMLYETVSGWITGSSPQRILCALIHRLRLTLMNYEKYKVRI